MENKTKPKRRIKKRWLILSPLILLGLFLWGTKLVFENGGYEVPSLAANLYARENCMCVFVMGFDEKKCEELTAQFIAPNEIKVDRTANRVLAKVLWARSEFAFQDRRVGCVEIKN